MMVIAISISVIAAWYSIAGLTAIFAAAVIPVIIMGGALEAGKIVATVWLHNNWKRITWAFKMYLIPAILFLMLLTSMGIFGFLSKAHSDQGLVSGDAMSKVVVYDENIKTAKENIEANRKSLKQMDEAVDNLMARSDDSRGAERSVQIRKSQKSERTRLNNEISTYQKEIAKLTEERAPFAAEFRKIEAEVGPIKYIAAFIYGDNPDANLLEKAVRWVIILIVIVFDPLALCLILASNRQLEWVKEEKQTKNETIYPDLSDEANIKIDELDPIASIIEVVEEETVFEIVEEKVEYTTDKLDPIDSVIEVVEGKKLDATNEEDEAFAELDAKLNAAQVINPQPIIEIGNCSICSSELVDIPNIGLYCSNPECNVLDDSIDEDEEEPVNESLVKLFQYGLARNIVVNVPDSEITTEGVTTEAFKNIDSEYVEFEGKHMHQRVLRGMRPDLFELRADSDNGTSTGFGTAFPETAVTGDVYVRVDVLPNRVYKFNRNKWMEINKDQSDSYLYNNKYMEFLVDKIAIGEVDP
ncbi:MAG: hypothetical protein ACOVLB_03790 [Candidatus Nanopelagicus sp.]